MGLFSGKKKTKKVYSTDLLATRVFEDDLLDQTKIRSVLEKVQKDLDSKTYVLRYGNSGAAQFFQYYLSGKYDYEDELPTSTIGAVGTPSYIIEDIIQTDIETEPISVMNTSYAPPSEPTWMLWRLQETIDYNVGINLVKIDDDYFTYSNHEYDETTNKFKVTLSTKYNITIVTREEKLISISNVNTTTDKRKTTITRYVSYIDSKTQAFLFDEETIVSVTNKNIPINTETSSITNKVISTEYYINPKISIQRTVSAYRDETAYYMIEYKVNNRTKLWIYDPHTNVYPQLKVDDYQTLEYESYPVTMFRNGVFSVREFDIDQKEVESGNFKETVYRPESITEKRYKETTNILSSIGLYIDDLLDKVEENDDIDKLQDAFVVIGVSPGKCLQTEKDIEKEINDLDISDPKYNRKLRDLKRKLENAKVSTSVISQALYRMFDYIYNKLPPTNVGANSTYYLTFEETPYNASLSWIPQLPTITKEKIGNIGTYTHEIKEEIIINEHEEIMGYYKSEGSRPMEHVYTYFYGRDGEPSLYTFNITTKEDGTKWANVLRQVGFSEDTENEPGGPIFKNELRQIFPIDYRTAKTIRYAEIPTENLILKHQISKTEVRTIRVGYLASFKGDGIFKKPDPGYPEAEPGSYETEAGLYLWSNTISRNGKSGTINLKFDSDKLVIPLPVFVVEQMTYMERVALMGASLHLIFYAAQYDKITYYSGGFFSSWLGILAMVVIIVITVVCTWGTTTGPAVAGAAGAGTAVGTAAATAAITAIVEGLMIGLALQVVLKIIASVVDDPALRMMLSIAAMVVAMYAGGGFDNFTLDLKTAVQLAEIPTKGIDIYIGAKTEQLDKIMGNLQSKISDFNELYKNRMEDLSDIMKDLNSGISTEFIVDLTTGIDQINTTEPSFSYSPSYIRNMVIDGYKNFDSLYTNDVANFFDNKFKLGVIDY